jgi:hypothetical protein
VWPELAASGLAGGGIVVNAIVEKKINKCLIKRKE